MEFTGCVRWLRGSGGWWSGRYFDRLSWLFAGFGKFGGLIGGVWYTDAFGDLVFAIEGALPLGGFVEESVEVIEVGWGISALGPVDGLSGAGGFEVLSLFKGGGLDSDVGPAEAELGCDGGDHLFEVAWLEIDERGCFEFVVASTECVVQVIGGVAVIDRAFVAPVFEDGAVEGVLKEVGVECDAGGAAFGALDEEAEDLGLAVGCDGRLGLGAADLGGCGDSLRAGGAAAGDELEGHSLIDTAETGEALDVVGADDWVGDGGDGGSEYIDGLGALSGVVGVDLVADRLEEVVGDGEGAIEQCAELVGVLADQ